MNPKARKHEPNKTLDRPRPKRGAAKPVTAIARRLEYVHFLACARCSGHDDGRIARILIGGYPLGRYDVKLWECLRKVKGYAAGGSLPTHCFRCQ